MIIRALEHQDRAAIVDIYNHYICETSITFDLEPYSVATRGPWFEQFDGERWQCWVAVHNGQVQGYANSGQFRSKAAYSSSVEVSVYLRQDHRGQGLGRALYQQLFAALEGHDVHRAYAGITQPNPASIALHQRMGFKPVGLFAEVGLKFGRYWDVAWFEKDCS